MLYIGLTLSIQVLLLGMLIFIDKYKNKIMLYFQSFILLINLLGYCFFLQKLEMLSINISISRFIYIILYLGIAFTFLIWGIYFFSYNLSYKLINIKNIFLNKKIIVNSFLVGFSHIGILGILVYFFI